MSTRTLFGLAAFAAVLAPGELATAQPREAIMFPIIAAQPTPGAYGSLWVTTLAVHNEGEQSKSILPICQIACPPPLVVAPGQTREIQSLLLPGSYLLVDSGYPLNFHLRARDLSRTSRSAGVEIPVVREDDFKPAVQLLNVPFEEDFRLSLRVYAARRQIDPQPQLFAQIRAFDDDGALIEELRLEIIFRGGGRPLGELHNLRSHMPQARTYESVRFEVSIEPDPEGPIHTWALITVTNNDTQEVTVISP